MAKRYHLANIRILLKEGFTSSELREFCFDTPDFRPVHNQVAENPSREDIVQKIVEFAELKLLIELILDWARKHNPARYELYQFYYSEDTPPITSEQPVIQLPSPLPSGSRGRSEIARNPFNIGSVSHQDFIERKEIIDYLYSKLAGNRRSNIAISGEYGSGKTPLLKYLKHIAEKEQWGPSDTRLIFIYFDCSKIGQFTPTRFWPRFLLEVKKEVRDSTLQEQIDTLLNQPEVDIIHFERLLSWLRQRQLAPVLLLDEFDWVVQPDLADRVIIRDFLAALRSLLNHHEYSLTLLTATRGRLHNLSYEIFKNYAGSPFSNSFIAEPLPPFSFEEFSILVKQALEQTDVEFDQDDCNFLYRIAGPHPALLQIASSHLFETRRQSLLTKQNEREEVIKDVESTGDHYFSSFWRNSSPLEQTLFILLIMSDLPGETFPEVDEIADYIRGQLQIYKPALGGLKERALIQKKGDNYQISSVVFATWIVRKVAAEDKTDLVERSRAINKELHRAWKTFRKLARPPDKLIQTLIGPLP